MDFSVETLTSLVELTVSCSNLRDRDVMSKSDPMCVLSQREQGADKWHEINRSEVSAEFRDHYSLSRRQARCMF